MKRRFTLAEDVAAPAIGLGVSVLVLGAVGYIAYNYIKDEVGDGASALSDSASTIIGEVKETLAPLGDATKDVLTVGGDVLQEGGNVLKEGLSVVGEVSKTLGGLLVDGVKVADVGIRYTANTAKDIAVGTRDGIKNMYGFGYEAFKKDEEPKLPQWKPTTDFKSTKYTKLAKPLLPDPKWTTKPYPNDIGEDGFEDMVLTYLQDEAKLK